MPELPEVETVRRGLTPAMEGQKILRAEVRRPDLRFPFPAQFAARLQGAKVTALGRKAKFLTAALSTGETLIMHLGMSGRFTIDQDDTAHFKHATGGIAKHDHVVFHLGSGTIITYNDPRRFGFMELWPTDTFHLYPRLQNLGPEPLTNEFNSDYLTTALSGKQTPIKTALLDQSIVAGLGNIYVCEALYRSGISPKRRAATIRGVRSDRLAHAINSVISDAISAGGSSISDFASTDGELGYFQHHFDVYDREGDPCPKCNKPIKRIIQAGRSTFYCSFCQR